LYSLPLTNAIHSSFYFSYSIKVSSPIVVGSSKSQPRKVHCQCAHKTPTTFFFWPLQS